MNIGIVVYSGTGFTKKFASLINEEMKAKGHNVTVTYLETDVPMEKGGRTADFRIMNMPDCSNDDLIIAGGPVWGGMPNAVTVKCLREMKGVEGKKAVTIATMLFPFKFMGGLTTLSKMRKILEERKCTVLGGSVLTRAWHDFDSNAEKETKRISDIIAHSA